MISLDGDESIIYDSTKTAIDAGTEQTAATTDNDTMVFNSGGSINFSLKHPKILNFEVIDLKNDADTNSLGSHSLTNLSLSDVINMTDADNDLTILGDAADNVSFKAGDGWVKGSTLNESGYTFDLYSNTGDASVKIKVEEAIIDTIL